MVGTVMVRLWAYPSLVAVVELVEGLVAAAVKVVPRLDVVVQPPLNGKPSQSTRPVLVILMTVSPLKSQSFKNGVESNRSQRVKPQMELPAPSVANWLTMVKQPSKRTMIRMVVVRIQKIILLQKKRFKVLLCLNLEKYACSIILEERER